jgi:hypothetical protein
MSFYKKFGTICNETGTMTINQTKKVDSKPKHTPGPWGIGEIINKNKLVKSALVLSPAGGVIATASNITLAGTLANAALIAAAPELLEALEYALADLERCKAHFMKTKDFGVSELAIGLAELALAKAKGETI